MSDLQDNRELVCESIISAMYENPGSKTASDWWPFVCDFDRALFPSALGSLLRRGDVVAEIDEHSPCHDVVYRLSISTAKKLTDNGK